MVDPLPRDPLPRLAQGRVQVIRVADPKHQALALVGELQRLRQLDPGLDWARCAVLAREWSLLDPVRTLCEAADIPVCLALPSDQQPPPFGVREHRLLLDYLGGDECQSAAVQPLLAWIDRQDGTDRPNSWWEDLRELLVDWQQQAGPGPHPVGLIEQHLCDALAELRRSSRLGKGVFLSTVHSAKGMQFDHVLLPDGGWTRASEDERRLHYVAPTRARETLCLFQRADTANPFLQELDPDALLDRVAREPQGPPPLAIDRTYAVLGLRDIDLRYAGRRPPQAPIHQALAGCCTGDSLELGRQGERLLLTHRGEPIAALSRQACEKWLPRLERIQSLRVLAMIQRTQLEGPEHYRADYRIQVWEVPMVRVEMRREAWVTPAGAATS